MCLSVYLMCILSVHVTCYANCSTDILPICYISVTYLINSLDMSLLIRQVTCICTLDNLSLCTRYVNHLEEARTFGIKKGYINGVSLGFVFLSLFVVEAFALWYGAQLVFSEEMSAGDMLIVSTRTFLLVQYKYILFLYV